MPDSCSAPVGASMRHSDAAASAAHLLTARGLSATLDDGRVLYAGLDLSLPAGPCALIGANGSGKTTVLRQLAGDLSTDGGSVEIVGGCAWLPQTCGPLPPRVLDLLGAGPRIDALRRLLAGSGSVDDVTCVDDDWALETRLRAHLDALGLSGVGLDDHPARLSGGERQQLRLLAVMQSDARVLLLDEPSTFLDAATSAHWRDAVLARAGSVLVVTHDPAWLAAMPRLVELRDGALHWTEGGLDAWRDARVARRARESEALADARTARARMQREATRTRMRLDQREARGRRDARTENQSPLLLDHRADRADRTAARARAGLSSRLAAHDTAVRQAFDAADTTAAPDFVDATALALPATRRVLTFHDVHPCARHPRRALDWTCAGPVRIGLSGANGSGKSTLLRAILGDASIASGRVEAHVPVQSLDQHLGALPDQGSALDWLAERMRAPSATVPATRLALLGLPGDRARQPLGCLSGGERMRVAVAAATWAQPAAPLLMLDEPASHLDLDSVEALVALLRGWPGALLVVSHDVAFLDALALTHRLRLDVDTLTLD